MEIIKGLSNLRVNEKDEAMFECKFNREPNFENVAWFKDDEQLSEDDSRIKFLNDGKRQFLIIKNAKLSDIANYTIKVKELESTGSLKVKGNTTFKEM